MRGVDAINPGHGLRPRQHLRLGPTKARRFGHAPFRRACWRIRLCSSSGDGRRSLAVVGEKLLGDKVDGFPVFAIGGPAACKIAVGHRALQAARLFNDAILREFRARRDGLHDFFAGIGDKMLDLRKHTSFHVREAVSCDPATRRT